MSSTRFEARCLRYPSTLQIFAAAAALMFLALANLNAADEPKGADGEQATPAETTPAETIAAGHSYHGEAFNEGPRQAAYLMSGMGQVDFPASSSNAQVRAFINQGVAQLHGFWYYEAERSFRQAAVLEPECAIAYWGMALANVENKKRARDFIAKAVERKEKASRQEQMFIDAYAEYFKEDEEGKKREKKDVAQRLTRDLETIVEEFPDSAEARAFLAVQLWQNERSDLPIVSHVAVNALLQDVFDANPMHPAHHYRIHLWDNHKAAQALTSAALCGQSSPGIAHMWHMPGHIYSKLHRYNDACWQQEASARVDHAHMMRDRLLPDQIHNFAHNNEWLIRNLVKVGRVNDGISLAKNMQELPRHPKYNSLDKGGSGKYGRERLLLVLSRYRLWNELIALADTVYLEPTDDEPRQNERLRYLGIAHALVGNAAAATEARAELERRLQSVIDEETKLKEPPPTKDATQVETAEIAVNASATEEKSSEVPATVVAEKCDDDKNDSANNASEGKESNSSAGAATNPNPEVEKSEDEKKADEEKRKKDEEEAKKKLESDLKNLAERKEKLEKQIAAIRTCESAHSGDLTAALELWSKSDLDDQLLKAEWLADSGKADEAIELANKEVDGAAGEVLPRAVLAWVKYRSQGASAATEAFEQLRQVAGAADLETPLLARLQPLAAELGHEQKWSLPYEPPADAGQRPSLDSLGPFRWQPYLAPNFAVETAAGKRLTLTGLSQQPTLVIFYLGFGCLHCVEQLQAFSPRLADFREQGINVIAISSEDLKSLNNALANYKEPLEVPLHADPTLAAFKSYRCYDDFESQPLHGTFLIDADGRVLWQDISYEPFMDIDFCLQESQRLLNLQ